MKKIYLFILFSICVTQIGSAQNHIYWSDDFSDADPLAAKNVGWLYLGEKQGVKDVIVKQQDGALFVQQGAYELVPGLGIGIGIIETNGVPYILWDNPDSTRKLIMKDDYSVPNQVLSFKFQFVRWRNMGESSSFFSINTRLQMTVSDSFQVPLSDATVEPGYAIAIWPISGEIIMGKYDSTAMAALFPKTAWKTLGQTTYKFELKKAYWAKFYLNEGDIRFKLWEGGSDQEPETWLLSATDPEPRVNGTYTGFGMLGPNPVGGTGEQLLLDDIKLEGWKEDTHIQPGEHPNQPHSFHLEQNYPNPFNPHTSIAFHLSASEKVTISIFNLKGEEVRILVNEKMSSGRHVLQWDGKDASGNPVPSGIFFYRLNGSSFSETKRMILLK